MATKARDVDWGELIDFESELFDWLAERQLVKPGERSLSAVIALHQQPKSFDPLVSNVVTVILKIEEFIGAGRRADQADRARLLAKAGSDARAVGLFLDDTLERQADGAIRAFMPKLEHIRRLTESIAARKEERFSAMRQDPKRIDFSHDEVLQRLEKVEEEVMALHLAFLRMNPCIQHEELTLTGGRAFQRRMREFLDRAGYRAVPVRKE
ncbi:MAG: hypothetical protein ACOY0T_19540 [Myxococcota bacterium]